MNIHSNINRVRRSLVISKFFDCFMDSFLIGLVISGGLLLFGVTSVYAFLLGGVYLVWGFIKASQQANLREIERKLPNLEWQLRTAADTSEQNNDIVDTLRREVVEKIGFVSFYDFLSGRRTIIRLFGIILLGFVVFAVHTSDFTFGTALETFTDSDGEGFSFGGGPGEGSVSGRTVYDERARESDSDADVELTTESNEIDLSQDGELETPDTQTIGFTGDVGVEQDASYSETIPPEEQHIVEQFYNNLNK